jgi:alpha-2-macroglobulin
LLEEEAIRSATGAYWELSQDEEGMLASSHNMQTNLSNTAIVLYALAQRDPSSPLIADTVRFLMNNRDADGAWASTYTTAWTLIGLDQVLKGTGELGGNYAFGASVNDDPIADGVAGGVDQLTAVQAQVPIQKLYPNYPNVLVVERSEGQGRLYYTAGLDISRPVEEVTPLSKGLTISRAVVPSGSDCESGSCEPIESAHAGQKVTVRLSLTLPQDMYYLAVTDSIPAGAEILDTSLKTSELGQDGGEPTVQTVYNPRRPFSEGWGWWFFNKPSIYDDHIAWTADSLPAGTYELTYTLVLLQPGQFRVLPARAWQIYFPETQANSAGSVFEIKP